MKFIKNYKLFLEADEVKDSNQLEITKDGDVLNKENDVANKQSLQDIKDELAYYNSKKSVMMDLFKDSKKSDDDLNNELQKTVYNNERDMKKRNKYLVDLEGLYRMKRRVDRTTLQITEDDGRKVETQRQINDLSDRFNQSEPGDQKVSLSTQIEKSRDYLKQLSDSIIFNKSELSKLDKNYQTKRKDFETLMKTEEQKIKNMMLK